MLPELKCVLHSTASPAFLVSDFFCGQRGGYPLGCVLRAIWFFALGFLLFMCPVASLPKHYLGPLGGNGKMGGNGFFFSFLVEKWEMHRLKTTKMHFLFVDLRGGANNSYFFYLFCHKEWRR